MMYPMKIIAVNNISHDSINGIAKILSPYKPYKLSTFNLIKKGRIIINPTKIPVNYCILIIILTIPNINDINKLK